MKLAPGSSRHRLIPVLFVLLGVLIHLPFVSINEAEYTDGILQLTLFEHAEKYWPPLYGLLSLAGEQLVGSRELAARFISLLAFVILFLPLYHLARRCFSEDVAIFACLLWLLSPVPWRWSIRVMTDSLFSLLFFSALYFLWRVFRDGEERAAMNLSLATLLAVLATLTRYQGVILLAPLVAALLLYHSRYHKIPLVPLLLNLLWLLPLWWLQAHGGTHTQQFLERTAPTLLGTLLAYSNNLESFVLLLPYFLTYPVAFFLLLGFFKADYKERGVKILVVLLSYTAVLILTLQSIFSSFQSRYLLPLFPLLFIFAGQGMAFLEARLSQRRWLFRLLLMATLLFTTAFSLTMLVVQRQTFGDLKQAALFLREQEITGPIYSNEYYAPTLPAPKLSFWSGKEIQLLTGEPLPPGSIVCVHSAYGGSEAFYYLLDQLYQRYQCEELLCVEASTIPLLPEVMQEPFSHQNPVAWVLRYQPQFFSTMVMRIEGLRDPGDGAVRE